MLADYLHHVPGVSFDLWLCYFAESEAFVLISGSMFVREMSLCGSQPKATIRIVSRG
jgi:hypothetical protein